MKPNRVLVAVAAMYLLGATQLLPTPSVLYAQASPPGSTSGDYTALTGPITCPTRLSASFTDAAYGLEFHGYEWTTTWDRASFDPAVPYMALYIPTGMIGTNYITSRDSKARWYNPQIEVRCRKTDYYMPGTSVWLFSDYTYQPVAFYETVREVVACNTTGGNTMYSDASYDPYEDSGGSTSGTDCSTSGGAGDGAGGCHEELVVTEISNDGGGSWSTLWEGLATVCDS